MEVRDMDMVVSHPARNRAIELDTFRIRSDAFIDMPEGARLLYMHLAFEADPGCCVDAATVGAVRELVGAGESDLAVLLGSPFAEALPDGGCRLFHCRPVSEGGRAGDAEQA